MVSESYNEIILGDCLEVMRDFPDNHFSAIVTDPPYGLSFMGKGWDHEVPQMHIWKEAFRITKPGSFLISMGGTRTFHRLCCAIEDADWEIRDCISWLYGSGFPKSHNHFGLSGYGTALKPAWEPCIVAMKPLDGTFKQNVEKWGQGGINIAASRIGSNRPPTNSDSNKFTQWKESDGVLRNPSNNPDLEMNKGRWPANVILDEEAAKMLDEQSGNRQVGQLKPYIRSTEGGYHGSMPDNNLSRSASSGGASRFFYCAKASSKERNEGLDRFPLRNIAQSNKWTDVDYRKGQGKVTSRGSRNNHPTVKPLKLMEYLIKLVMPPSNGLLLDPFAGSGTTILAAKRLGFNAIGIEKCHEYAEIARARLVSKEPEEPDLVTLAEAANGGN